jgi:hypothetical protein
VKEERGLFRDMVSTASTPQRILIEGLLIGQFCRIDIIIRPFESAFAKHTYLFRKGTFLSVKLFGTLAPLLAKGEEANSSKPTANSLKPIKWLSQKTRNWFRTSPKSPFRWPRPKQFWSAAPAKL